MNQVTLKSAFFRNRKRSFNTNNVKFFHHLLCVSVNLGMYGFSFPTASSQTILLFCTTNKFRNIQEINKNFLLERSLSAVLAVNNQVSQQTDVIAEMVKLALQMSSAR